jgi:hypothetical protein
MPSIILSGDITKEKTLAEDAFLSNQVLLGLQTGGRLWRIQRTKYIYRVTSNIYSSFHNRESTTDPESRVHPQVTRSKPHAYTYNYYFNLQRPID